MEIYVEKDGKILKIGKDVQLTIHGDRIQLDVINPKREKSGVYKVVMKNAQGQDEKLINVNIMDVPTPPASVFVDTVFQDNCVVHWSPPKDNGGTEIKKYVVEVSLQHLRTHFCPNSTFESPSCNYPQKYELRY